MRLRDKRWIYEVEGRRMSVENAWSWPLWAQERVVFDGETLRAAGAYLTMDRNFTLPASETGLSRPLHVTLYSGLFTIQAIVLYGDTPLEPLDVQTGIWRERKGGWPPAEPAAV
ncbi:MAG: hypothetical protein RKE49_13105 [Oceanicaulis sp.]